jgi:hypothetical protein
MRFSERQGFKNYNDFIQTESMNESLRNSIWNTILTTYYNAHIENCVNIIAYHFRKTALDELPNDDYDKRDWLKKYFYDLNWYEVYDLIEFLVSNHNIIVNNKYTDERPKLRELWNNILERENSGYRFIGESLAPISNPIEIDEVNETLELTVKHRLQGPYNHIKTAIEYLSKKPEPDYRNSIKESISAIESISKIISKEDSQGLAGALKVLSEKVNMHGALKQSFLNLFGYTSDEGGIRHSLLEQSKVSYDEAKYMLVCCSAFLNYLIAKSVEANLL